MNPSTAFATVFADELARCGVREVVLAPGSRSTPMAMAFHALDVAGRLRLHVRIDERSVAFTALGLAKAGSTGPGVAGPGGRAPVAIVCTSGTAAANFHPAIIEASESGVPLLVLTADRPPELRGAGANQTIDQVKLYGDAVRWYADPGVPDRRAGAAAAWRSLACQAYALASGVTGTFPGPVHVNLPFREPLVPDGPVPDGPVSYGPLAVPPAVPPNKAGSAAAADPADWPESLAGRPGGEAWTRYQAAPSVAGDPPLALPWTERGVVVCGDGDYDPGPMVAIAEQAGWPVLAEPSSNARRGPSALIAYQYLLASPEFVAAHRPDMIISAGRPGLSRPQSALLRASGARHVVIAQGPGRWADQARVATDVAASVRLAGASPAAAGWLAAWRRADAAARAAADAVLDDDGSLSEPRLARDFLLALPEGALAWIGSSMPIRDVDATMRPRADIRVLASRGASGIDGTTSTAIGAALAHQSGGGGPAFALIGDLAVVHDAPGLAIGPGEPRPDLCLIVVNNDGGAIFSTLEQARFAGPFERVFGTPHGTSVAQLAEAFGVAYARAQTPEDVAKAVAETEPGSGLRLVEVRTDRAAQTELRARVRAAAIATLG